MKQTKTTRSNYLNIKQLLILMLFIFFSSTTTQKKIILNPSFPISIKYPVQSIQENINYSSNFIFNISIIFKLPPESSGVTRNQFIGLQFPPYESFQFDNTYSNENNAPDWTCKLFKVSDKTEIAVEASKPISSEYNAAEANTVYCKITQNKILTSVIDLNNFYKLELYFSRAIKQKEINNIHFFTSTSNTPEKIIIDSHFNIGTIGLLSNFYEDNINSDSSAIQITDSSSVTVIDGLCSNSNNILNNTNCSTVYPYNIVKFNLHIKINKKLLTNKNMYLGFSYPSDLLEVLNLQVISIPILINDKLTNLTREIQSNSNINIEKLDNNSYKINNISEDLIKNREFILELRGFRTKLPGTGKFSVFSVYENSYTMIAYTEYELLNVKQGNISYLGDNTYSTGINHPEYWDIYSNAAWPFKFNFSVNTDFYEGGFLVLTNTNTKDTYSRLNFIASTCDFSEFYGSNESEYLTLGKRNNCFPLRNDFNYSSSSDTEYYEGSGIFFHINTPIKRNVNYSFVVWAYVDRCGNKTDPTQAQNSEIYLNSVFQFKFKYRLYDSINAFFINEKRFSNSIILASSEEITMGNTCYNTSLGSNKGMYGNSVYIQQTADCNTTLSCPLSPTITENWKEVFLMREFYDFSLGYIYDYECKDCFLNDVTATDTVSFPRGFIYSSDAYSLTQREPSYFLIKWHVYKSTPVDVLRDYLPVNLYAYDATTSIEYYYQAGRLAFQFTSNYFIPGESIDDCYLSWADNQDKNSTKDDRINTQVTLDKTIINESIYAKNNFIQATNPIETNIQTLDFSSSYIRDTAFSSLPKETQKYSKIYSYYDSPVVNSTTGEKFSFFMDTLNKPSTGGNVNPTLLYMFSNCVRIVNYTPSIKSLFTYFDFQVTWESRTADSNFGEKLDKLKPTRLWRFIKLLPEAGALNNFDISPIKGFDKSPITNHFNTGINSEQNSICLVEINAEIATDSTANTLIVWLHNVSLIETDYTDPSANYPMAPLQSEVKTYGFSSAPSMSNENEYNNSLTDYAQSQTKTIYVNLLQRQTEKVTLQSLNSRTLYHYFLSSFVVVSNLPKGKFSSSDETQVNSYIPYYCPLVQSDSNKNFTTKVYSMITYINFNYFKDSINYQSIQNSSKIITNSTGNAVFYSNKNTLINYDKTIGFNTDYKTTIKYSKFSLTDSDNDKILYVLNGTKQNKGKTTSCSGFSLFLNSSDLLESSKSVVLNYFKSDGSETNKSSIYISSNNYFYILGKAFKVAIFNVTETGKAAYVQTNTSDNNNDSTSSTQPYIIDSLSNVYYSGLNRPDISNLDYLYSNQYRNSELKGYSNGKILSSVDSIFFSCAHYGIITPSLNNSIFLDVNITLADESTTKVNFFVVDYSIEEMIDWKVSLNNESLVDLTKNDPGMAVSVNISITNTSIIPLNSYLKLKSANYNSITKCGIVVESSEGSNTNTLNSSSASEINLLQDCYKVESDQNSFFCLITNKLLTSTNFKVSCYNINNKPDPFVFVDVSIYLDPPLSYVKEYINTSLYYLGITKEVLDSYNLSLNQNSLYTFYNDPLFYAYIENIHYYHSSNFNAIGIMALSIKLPRELPINSIITINGDFSMHEIPSTPISCSASFLNTLNDIDFQLGSTWLNGDMLIDSCIIKSSLNEKRNSIIIKLKNELFSYSNNFSSKHLVVKLVPVILKNTANYSYNSFDSYYNISLEINSDIVSYRYLAATVEFKLPSIDSKIKNLSISDFQKKSLCPISSLSPRFTGLVSEMEFVFDLSKVKYSLASFFTDNTKYGVNEFSIYLSYELFGDLNYGDTKNDNIICKIRDIIVSCYVQNNFLNIFIPSNVGIYTLLMDSYKEYLEKLSNTQNSDKDFLSTVFDFEKDDSNDNNSTINNEFSFIVKVFGFSNPLIVNQSYLYNSAHYFNSDFQYTKYMNIEFPCSVNYYDPDDDVRYNLVTGSGSVPSTYKFNDFETSSILLQYQNNNIKVLDYYNHFIDMSTTIFNKVPRELNKMRFVLFIDDFFNRNISFPYVINNPPIDFIITLPESYDIGILEIEGLELTASIVIIDKGINTNYSNSNYNLKFDLLNNSKLLSNTNQSEILVMKKTLTPTISIKGNNIYLTINNSISLSSKFKYFVITVTGVNNPFYNIQSTGKFDFTVTNSDFSIILKTITNLSNLSVLDNPISSSDKKVYHFSNNKYHDELNYYKGFNINWTSDKYTIDIQALENDSDSSDSVVNIGFVKAGRFTKHKFLIRSTNKTIENLYLTTITPLLSEGIVFQYNSKSYNLYSATKMNILEFYIGTSCLTPKGNYFAAFSSSNSTNYFRLGTINVIVSRETKGVVSVYSRRYNNYLTKGSNSNFLLTSDLNLQVYKNSSLYVFYSLSEPNVDSMTIKWSGHRKNYVIEVEETTLSKLSLEGSTKFSINSREKYSTEYFLGILYYSSDSNVYNLVNSSEYQTINKCYILSQDIIEITVSKELFTFDVSISSHFSYIPIDDYLVDSIKDDNYDIETNIQLLYQNITSLNSFAFNFTPQIQQTYLYCALVCISNENHDYINEDLFDYFTTSFIKSKGIQQLSNNLLFKNEETLMHEYYRKSGNHFYGNFLFTSKKAEILFTNLRRGLDYELLCMTTDSNNDETGLSMETTNFTYFNVSSKAKNLTTTDQEDLYCYIMKFNRELLSNERQVMLEMCQQHFSSEGYMTKGCVTCTDYHYNTAKSFVNQDRYIRTCYPDNFNSSNYDIEMDDDYYRKKPNTNYQENYSIELLNTTITQSPEYSVFNSTNNKNYMLCVYQKQICSTDYGTSTEYSDKLTAFKTNYLNDTYVLNQKLLEFGVVNNSTNSLSFNVTEIKENTSPDISQVTVNNFTISNNTSNETLFSYKMNSTEPLNCYFTIIRGNSSEIIPAFDDLLNCKVDFANITRTYVACGNTRLYKEEKIFNKNIGVLTWLEDAEFTLWVGCYMDAPFAEKKSTISALGTYTYSYVSSSNNSSVSNNCFNVGISYFSILIIIAISLFS